MKEDEEEEEEERLRFQVSFIFVCIMSGFLAITRQKRRSLLIIVHVYVELQIIGRGLELRSYK